jgi:uncharacterized membrane protein
MRYEDDRLERLEKLVEELRARIDLLEGRTQPPHAPEPAPAPAAGRREAAPEPPPAAPTSAPSAATIPKLDLEDLLGRRVLAWVGSIAVLLGVVFFLATAIRRGWIDETTRVALAYLGSTALLAAGLYLYERQGRTQAALGAVATAIAALYASTTAGTQLYGLIDPVVGLGVAGLVGVVATAVAVRWSSPIVAAIGIVGAILSPVLVDAGTSGYSLAFMAVALCAASGVLIWQRWDWLAAGAFVTSAPQLLFWLFDRNDDAIVLSLVVLGLFWAVYVVAAIGYELRVPTEKLRLSSASLLLTDAVLLAGAGWLALEDAGHGDAGTLWVIGTALAHVVLGTLTLRGRISREIALLLLAVGIGLSAIGLALAFDGPALVAAWSVEAVLLTWLARRTGEDRGYVVGAGFLALASLHALTIDAEPTRLVDEPDATAVVAVALVAAAAFASAYLYRGPWAGWSRAGELLGAAALAYLVPLAFEGLPVVLGWTVLATMAAVAGRERALAAPFYLALAAAHAVSVEVGSEALREGVEDLAVAAAALGAVVLALFAVLRLTAFPRDLQRALEIAGPIGVVYLPSVAIVDLTTTGELDPGQTPQVLLSAFWSLTGLAALVYGLLRDDRRFRLGGLALLGVAIVKVYLYDLASLDEIYRVLSFIALGLLLLAAAFAYQRVRKPAP